MLARVASRTARPNKGTLAAGPRLFTCSRAPPPPPFPPRASPRLYRQRNACAHTALVSQCKSVANAPPVQYTRPTLFGQCASHQGAIKHSPAAGPASGDINPALYCILLGPTGPARAPRESRRCTASSPPASMTPLPAARSPTPASPGPLLASAAQQAPHCVSKLCSRGHYRGREVATSGAFSR